MSGSYKTKAMDGSRRDPESTTAETPPAAPNPGLARFQERFRTLTEHTTASLREQAEVFGTILKIASSVMDERTALAAERDSLRSAVEKLTQEQSTLRDAIQSADRDHQELLAAHQGLEAKHATVVTTCQELTERLDHADNTNNRLTTTNSALEQELAAVTESAENANRELHTVRQSLQGQLADLKASNQALQKRSEALERSNEELKRHRSELEQKIGAFRTQVAELQARVEAAGREQVDLQTTNRVLKEQIVALQDDLQALRAQAEATEEERRKLLATRQTLETCLADLSVKSQEMEAGRKQPEQARANDKELAALRQRVAELEVAEQELAVLWERIAELEATEKRLLGERSSQPDVAAPKVAALEKRIAELEATEKRLLGERSKQPDVPAPKVTALEKRIAELEATEKKLLAERSRQPEVPAAKVASLQERIAELEAALEDAHARRGGGGQRDRTPRDLTEPVRAVRHLATALRHPTSDVERKSFVHTAAELAIQLDVLNASAELAQADGTAELTCGLVNPAAVLGRSVEALARAAEDKGLKLVGQVDPAVPEEVLADESRLRQLLGWATMFVTRHAARGTVDILVDLSDTGRKYLRFTVRNDGTGLSADQVKLIINRCVTDPGLVAEMGAFTKLAEAMGGTIRVEPAGKQGFAARLTIECREPEPEPRTDADDRRRAPRSRQELLQCSLGPVVDLSITGARVVTDKRLKGHVVLEIISEQPHLKLRAYAVWTNRISRKWFEVGLRFIDLKPVDLEQLQKIMKRHGVVVAR